MFHLSLAGPDARVPMAVRAGLAVALDGGSPAEPFLGWTLGPHPLLTVATLE